MEKITQDLKSFDVKSDSFQDFQQQIDNLNQDLDQKNKINVQKSYATNIILKQNSNDSIENKKTQKDIISNHTEQKQNELQQNDNNIYNIETSEKIFYIQDISPKGILAREFPDLNSKIRQLEDGKKLGTKGQNNIYEASQKFELNIQKTEIEQFHKNKKIEIPFNEIQIVFYFINDIRGWIFDTHLSNFQKIVKEITEDQFRKQKNDGQNMEQKNKNQQKSVCKTTTVSFYITNCPNCQTSIQIRQNQINCGIFRCGTYKSNNRQIPSHLPKSQCEILVAKKLIYGCGKPFKVQKNRDIGNIEAKKCDYI